MVELRRRMMTGAAAALLWGALLPTGRAAAETPPLANAGAATTPPANAGAATTPPANAGAATTPPASAGAATTTAPAVKPAIKPIVGIKPIAPVKGLKGDGATGVAAKDGASAQSPKAPAGAPGKPAAPQKAGQAPAAGASADGGNKTGGPVAGKVAGKGRKQPKGKSPKAEAPTTDGAPGLAAVDSPATPPPMTMGGLRDELRREGAPVAIDPGAPARTKIEQMLAEVTKTREAMRADTARLEVMMSDGAEGAAAAGGPAAAAAGAATGKPLAKHPLDVLAKALRGIKPELAAPIVARLDRKLAATVLLRMPPVDAGKIMGALKPDTAAELATHIAMRAPPGEAKR